MSSLRLSIAGLFLALSSCCCCSSEWLHPVASDEPDVEREARDYVSEHAETMFPAPDGGVGECSASALAADLGAALVTLGHAGGSQPAAEVVFDPISCFRRIVVYVAYRSGAWVAIGAIVYERFTVEEQLRIGVPSNDFSAMSDTDTSSGEFF